MSTVKVHTRARSAAKVAQRSVSKLDVRASNITINEAPEKSGIGYMRSNLWSGQTTSYFEGDEGWNWQNGEFNNLNTENCEYIQSLNYDSQEPLITLRYKNKYGSFDRFTDFEGLQNYPNVDSILPSNLNANYRMIIDHLYNVAYVSRVLTHGYHDSIFTGIEYGKLYTAHGLSGFKVAGIKHFHSLTNINNASNMMNFFPFVLNIGGAVINTSTLRNASNLYAYFNNDYRILLYNSSTTYNYMFYKNLD